MFAAFSPARPEWKKERKPGHRLSGARTEKREGKERRRSTYRKGGCVSIGDHSPAVAFLFLSFQFQFRSSGTSLRRKTRPTDSRPCLYNVMACASIVPALASHSSCTLPLRDSLSAFVWHFITPLDCRIKHPAKGIPTLAACATASVARHPRRADPCASPSAEVIVSVRRDHFLLSQNAKYRTAIPTSSDFELELVSSFSLWSPSRVYVSSSQYSTGSVSGVFVDRWRV